MIRVIRVIRVSREIRMIRVIRVIRGDFTLVLMCTLSKQIVQIQGQASENIACYKRFRYAMLFQNVHPLQRSPPAICTPCNVHPLQQVRLGGE